LIQQKLRDQQWFVPLRRNPAARFRLIIFPCAGASAYSYGTWAADLPPLIEAWVLQMPGRGERFRELSMTDLGELTRRISDNIGFLTDLPYALFGHSLGSLVAFETTRELRRRGFVPPVHLFAAGRAAPQVPDLDRPLHGLPDEELLVEIGKLGGIPEEVRSEPDLMELILPPLRADLYLHETYIYKEAPPLACPIFALGGVGDTEVPEHELSAWSVQTSSTFQMRMFAGGHFFVHSERLAVLRLLHGSLVE
jgi:surfactin synthase thioesterase subunit